MPLCTFCDSLDFSVAGLHQDGLSGDQLFFESRPLKSLLDNATDCVFCSQVAQSFNEWMKQNPGYKGLDIDRTDVEVEIGTTGWRDDNDKDKDDEDDEDDEDGDRYNKALLIQIYARVEKGAMWSGPVISFQRWWPDPDGFAFPDGQSTSICACFESGEIVDVSGSDAFCGISGIRESLYRQTQQPFEVKGAWLLRTLDPPTKHSSKGIISDTVWNSRGWTFQELILSKRALIFTKDQVYWQCQSASWCEDGLWERPTHFYPTIYRNSMGEIDFRDLSNAFFLEWNYRKLVSRYSERALSNQSDALNPFAGIIGEIERETGEKFILPLPRRGGKTTIQGIDRSVRHVCFPSWSWVGWNGPISFDGAFGVLDARHTGLDFYRLDMDGDLELVIQNTEFREFIKPVGGSYSWTFQRASGSTDHTWREIRPTQVTKSDIPKSILGQNVFPMLLCFWTSTSILRVEHDRGSHLGEEVPNSYKPLLRYGEITLDVFWRHVPTYHEDMETEDSKFIVVGRDTLDSIRKERRLAVLMVRTTDGIAERRGLVLIKDEEWCSLNRAWELVVLG